MKLGISYNVFDGEELLEDSIKQIKSEVDYISVVYQTKSNLGNECNKTLVDLLETLLSNKLIDHIEEYEPFGMSPHTNEIKKRNIGLELSKKNGCTHHMSMDTDEYYDIEQFKFIKKIIDSYGFDSSFCQMKTYYKSWEFQLDPPEEYYVSLIYKINPNSKYVLGHPSPVLVDPTRRMSNSINPVIFSRNDIEMHHGSYIRDNIRLKLDNSSASVNFKDNINKLVSHFNNWKYPDKALWGGIPCVLHTIKKVENKFKNN